MSKLRINDLESLDTGITVGVDILAGIPAELDRRVIYVDTIADLKALPTSEMPDGQQVRVKEYNAGTGVGGGEFYWDAANSKPENGGTIFGDSAQGRWIRVTDGKVASPFWWGLPLTSSGVDYASELQQLIEFPIFEFPKGFSCQTSTLFPASDTVGHFKNATLKLIDGADNLTPVFSFEDLGGGIPENVLYYGGSIDGNRGMESGEGDPGQDGGLHGCRVYAARSCEWHNPKFINCASDGIYINEASSNSIEGIQFFSPYCDNNSRQGLSVIQCTRADFHDAQLLNTNGKMPEAGIDIEPNQPGESIVVNFYGQTICKDNAGRGFFIHGTGSTATYDIFFDKLVCEGNLAQEALRLTSGGIKNFTANSIVVDKRVSFGGSERINFKVGKMEITSGPLITEDFSGDFYLNLIAGSIEVETLSTSSSSAPVSLDSGSGTLSFNVGRLVSRNTGTDASNSYAGVITGGIISIDEAVPLSPRGFLVGGTFKGGRGINIVVNEAMSNDAVRLSGTGWKVSGHKSVSDGQAFVNLQGSGNDVNVQWDNPDALVVEAVGATDNKVVISSRGSSTQIINLNSTSNNNLITASYLDSTSGPVADSGTGNVVAGSYPLSVNS